MKSTTMKSISLRTTTAIALVLGASAAYAQAQQKDQGSTERQGQVQGDQRGPGAGEKAAQTEQREPRDQGATKTERDDTRKGAAQKSDEPKQKGATQKSAEPKDTPKGKTQKSAEPKDTTPKGDRQKSAEPKDRPGKGTAQKDEGKTEPGKGTKEKAAGAPDRTDPNAKKASTPRAQLSDQQRSRVRETLSKHKGAQRVTNVNFSISIGSRVPRSVRLAVLPAAVIEIVPEYRDYHYVIVREEIIIVEPTTYEIVAVLPAGGSVAGGGSAVRLSLSGEQRTFILRNVDMRSESRLGIGGLTIGIEVPRNAEVREFPTVVVERIPELRSYRYFVSEKDLAIVDPSKSKVTLVIEGNR